MDHLLSMELFEIEKQPYENFGDYAKALKFSKKLLRLVLLGFERSFFREKKISQ